MGLISTILVLLFPFGMIVWWIYGFRHARNPGSVLGRILAVGSVVVTIFMPIADIVYSRQILALRPTANTNFTAQYFYLSATAIIIYFALLVLAFIYFCYELAQVAKAT